jgi:hypothetical protein
VADGLRQPSRAIRRREGMFRRAFGLTPPRFITFLVSLILVIVAVASLYARLPIVGAFINSHRFWIAVAGYAVLMLGVLLRRL